MKSTLRLLLLIASSVVFCALGVFFYFVHDFEFGFEITEWTLPIGGLLVAVFVLILLLVINRNLEKRLSKFFTINNIIGFCIVFTLVFFTFDLQYNSKIYRKVRIKLIHIRKILRA